MPERWLGEARYAGDKRAVMQPFHVGPRNCLGIGCVALWVLLKGRFVSPEQGWKGCTLLSEKKG